MSHPLIPNEVPVTLEQLQAYWTKLRYHDWYYEYTEDGSVYRRGAKEELEINLASKLSPQHKALFEGFRAHFMVRGPKNEILTPMPPEPTSL